VTALLRYHTSKQRSSEEWQLRSGLTDTSTSRSYCTNVCTPVSPLVLLSQLLLLYCMQCTHDLSKMSIGSVFVKYLYLDDRSFLIVIHSYSCHHQKDQLVLAFYQA
jgi:hypothetical protein